MTWKRVRRALTPESTGMTREEIIEHVCAAAPEMASYIREHAADALHRNDWPVIESIWTDEFIYAFAEEHRPLVEVRRTLIWQTTWRSLVPVLAETTKGEVQR